MSTTRYIWKKVGTKTENKYTVSQTTLWPSDFSSKNKAPSGATYIYWSKFEPLIEDGVYVTRSTEDDITSVFASGSNRKGTLYARLNDTGYGVPSWSEGYKYAFFGTSNPLKGVDDKYFYYNASSNAWFSPTTQSSTGDYYITLVYTGSTIRSYTCNYISKTESTIKPDDSKDYGYATSTKSNAYPNNAASGNYWYYNRGSDEPMPISGFFRAERNGVVTTITEGIPGENVQYIFTIESSSLPTVYYTYEISENSGPWTDIGTGTVNDDINEIQKAWFGISYDCRKFRLRISAYDNYGYRSPSYYEVELPIVGGFSGNIFIGINNIARQVNEIYVGVNGVARKVKEGFVGVNGIARRFL